MHVQQLRVRGCPDREHDVTVPGVVDDHSTDFAVGVVVERGPETGSCLHEDVVAEFPQLSNGLGSGGHARVAGFPRYTNVHEATLSFIDRPAHPRRD
jgi:hypothetical protein